MLFRLQRIAVSLRVLRLPLVILGLICLTMATLIVFSLTPANTERFLIPSCVGMLWALSAYSFIGTFQFVPGKADESFTFSSRLKRNMHRAWYWIIGFITLGVTIAAVYVTNRMISIWLGA
jgi:hypothetical protein